MTDFEDFHIVAQKQASDRSAALLSSAGVRIQERVIAEIGRPEYVIAVHLDDIERASEVFRNDLGSGRTNSNSAEPGATADGGGM